MLVFWGVIFRATFPMVVLLLVQLGATQEFEQLHAQISSKVGKSKVLKIKGWNPWIFRLGWNLSSGGEVVGFREGIPLNKGSWEDYRLPEFPVYLGDVIVRTRRVRISMVASKKRLNLSSFGDKECWCTLEITEFWMSRVFWHLRIMIIARQLENGGNNARCTTRGHGISITDVSTLIQRIPYSWKDDHPQY